MTKQILVLARRDPIEAMRVAAGITALGHQVRLVFLKAPAESTEAAAAAELLELAEIAPETAVAELAGELPLLDAPALAAAIRNAGAVLNV